MKNTSSEEGSLCGKIKPYLHVQYGDDGNPEITTTCTSIEATRLCVALAAGLASTSADPETWLIRVMTNAANLVSRVRRMDDEEES